MDDCGVAAISSIPCALRPSQSLVDEVKNTLGSLVSAGSGRNKSGVVVSPHASDEAMPPPKSAGGSATSGDVYASGRTKTDFLNRIKTFSPEKWHGKPLCLSPPLFAQYGWQCIGEDLVKCNTCASVVAVRLPWPNSDTYENKVTAACSNLKDGHSKLCSWTSSQCLRSCLTPFDELYLAASDKDKLQQDFCRRVRHLQLLKSNLPALDEAVLSELSLSPQVVRKLYAHFFGDVSDKQPPGDVQLVAGRRSEREDVTISSVVLALCGWNCSEEVRHDAPSIRCDETNRTVGLWNFYSIRDDHVIREEKDENEEPATKRRKAEDNKHQVNRFHPLEQNYMWSPWSTVLSSPDSAPSFMMPPVANCTQPGKKPGWLVLRDLLLKRADLTRHQPDIDSSASSSGGELTVKTPPRAAVQRAKSLLKEWAATSPRVVPDDVLAVP